jgi:glycosyltransferase involved in cell wall biosynthesis
MKIAVNTRFLLKDKLEGIGWFTHEIFKRMVRNHPEDEFIFIFDRAYDEQFIFADNITPIVISPPARHPILWKIWFDYSIPKILNKIKPDIFISTDGFASLKTDIPQITTIHDLAFEHYPEHLPFKFRYYLRKFTPKFARKVNHIVTVSEFSKSDIEKQYNIPAEKISVVFNGAHQEYKPLSQETIESVRKEFASGKPYFVFAGALHPRKNIEALLEAFEQFKNATKSDMQLLLIGRFAWKAEGIKKALVHHKYRDDIHNYDYMNVDKLSKIIGSAFALTFVSLFEGFGIPILEAIRCNVPSITSNKTSMPEVAGKSGILVNPSSTEEITDAMIDITENPIVREQLVSNCAEQSKKFSWDISSERFYEIIQKEISTKVDN